MVAQFDIAIEESEVLARIRNQRRNASWVQEQMKKLRKEYPRKFIAVKDKKVIDSDGNFDELLKRVRKKVEDLGTVSFEYISDEEYIYVL